MRKRVETRYSRTRARSWNIVDIVGKELWALTASFNWDTAPLWDSMRLSGHATHVHNIMITATGHVHTLVVDSLQSSDFAG